MIRPCRRVWQDCGSTLTMICVSEISREESIEEHRREEWLLIHIFYYEQGLTYEKTAPNCWSSIWPHSGSVLVMILVRRLSS